MPDSYFEYTNTPTNTSFTFPFRFIAQGDVHVLGFNESTSVYTDLDSLATVTPNENNQGGTVTLATDWNSLGTHNILRIYRATSTTQLVDFENGSRLTATDLDNAYQQSLYVAQEVTEDANTTQFVLQKNLTDTALTNVASFNHTDLTGDGTTTVFNLTFTPVTVTEEAYLVYINGLVQPPDTYTITIATPSTITFDSAPADTAVVTVVTLASSNVATTVDNVTLEVNPDDNKISVKDGGITEAKLASSAVGEAELIDGSVTTAKIANDAVTSAKIDDGAVGYGQIASGSIDSGKLLSGCINTSKLQGNSVTEAKLVDGAVTESKLGTGSVTTTKLADSGVTTAKLADNSVTTAKVLDSAITADKLSINELGNYLEWDKTTGHIRLGQAPKGANIRMDVDLRGVVSIGAKGTDTDLGFIHQDANSEGVCLTGQATRVTAGTPDLSVKHTGDIAVTKKLTVGDDTSITGDIDATGDATIGGKIVVTGNMVANGTTKANGDLVVGGEVRMGAFSGSSAGLVLQDDRLTMTTNNAGIMLNRLSDGNSQVFKRGSIPVGNIAVTTSATSYNTSSDYRLKENIQDIEDADEKVLSLKPINFKWKVSDERVDGFLAHEVQTIVPEAVTGEKDAEEMQSIDQSKLVPLLTAALQDALKSIKSLEERVTALES